MEFRQTQSQCAALCSRTRISNWNRLPDKDKKELSENFDYFFQLKPAERQKAIKILSKERAGRRLPLHCVSS